MLYFDADPHSAGDTALACKTCCCQPLALSPGLTELMMINYASFAVPIAPPGLVPGSFEYSVEVDNSACSTQSINNFGPPTNTNYYFIIEPSERPSKSFDLTTNEGPQPGSAKEYTLVPLSGPKGGEIENWNVNGTFDYVPNSGFNGFDYFNYQMCDQEGRCIIRTVQIVSTIDENYYDDARLGAPNLARMSNTPYIEVSKVMFDTRMQTVRFPIYMFTGCQKCQSFRLTIQVAAKDCDQNIYTHRTCFDVRCSDCG